MKRKNLILSVAAMLCCFGSAWSQAAVGHMQVTMTDSKQEFYTLEDSPQITFPGSEIKIISDNAEASFLRADVADIRFIMVTFDNLPEADMNATYHFSYTDGIVTVKSSDVNYIELFDTNGRHVASAKAKAGVTTLSLAELPKAVYIVKIPGHSSVKIK